MTKPNASKFGLTPTRLFLIAFFGLALLLALATIVTSLGGWTAQDSATQAPAVVPTPAGQ